MRVSRASWTFSVVACCLLTPAVLTLAALTRTSSDTEPALDFPYTPTGHASSDSQPSPLAEAASHSSSGDSRSPSPGVLSAALGAGDGTGEQYAGENWRRKTLSDDGKVISDSSRDFPNDSNGNSRYGAGNPRLKIKSVDRETIQNLEKDGTSVDGHSSPPSDKQNSPKTLQKPSQAGGNSTNVHRNSRDFNSFNDSISATAAKSVTPETAAPTLSRGNGNAHAIGGERMMGDDPGISSHQSQRANSSGTGSISSGDLSVYPSPVQTFFQDDIQLGCRELRARRYITDGFCTSEDPIKEVVCTGSCLPVKTLPWYSEFLKTMSSNKIKQYQCVDDITRRKKVKLLCQDGSLRAYRIKVVKSCRCEKIGSRGNRASPAKRRRKGRRRKRKGKNASNRDKKKRRRRRRRKNKKTGRKAKVKGGGGKRGRTSSSAAKGKKDKLSPKTPSGS